MRGPCLRFNLALAAVIAVAAFAVTSAARAQDTDSYGTVAVVPVPAHAIACNFAMPDTSFFTFDISWIGAARGEFLLADSSHGRPSSDTEGGLLSGATDGDILLIDTNNPGNGPIYILPPRDDPFAGRRCDDNTNFGGVPTPPSRNEISGPNGVFTVNDTEAWVADGPSRFNPGQTNSATDYVNNPCDSSVRVFSLLTRRQIDHINVHGCFRTDEGAFDPVDQVVLFANPSEQPSVAAIDPHARPVDHSAFITLISAQPSGLGDNGDHEFGHHDPDQGRHAILKQINFDGRNGTINADMGIEQAVYSRQTGYFYIAIPGTTTNLGGYVVVVDPRPGHLNVVHNYPLARCAPAGAALGPNYELFLGCGSGPLEVFDIQPGPSVGTETPITGSPNVLACDEVAYDAGSGHFGGACITATTGGQFEVLVSDAHALNFDTAVGGAFGAHSLAADPISATFWMPMYGGSTCGTGNACVGVFGGDDSDATGN